MGFGAGDRFELEGVISSVLLQPKQRPPQFEALFRADSEEARGKLLNLVWLGQRQIVGLKAGAKVKVSGTVSANEKLGLNLVYNPEYTLL